MAVGTWDLFPRTSKVARPAAFPDDIVSVLEKNGLEQRGGNNQ